MKSMQLMSGTKLFIPRLYYPCGFWQRLRGLIGHEELTLEEGFLLPNCKAIHMFGMRRPLDIVFLDAQFKILHIVNQLPPGRFAFCGKSQHTLELKSGAANKLKLAPGQQFTIKEGI
ncbi:DUF192 domain-containing protein [Shewanella submarina]|uniref:DUF192 domain-containing protein n=1 Tax=Shewanella submarina TaxID=2016376 RepID=A0ABV7GBN2_9GAMM|nr:DUF192 domain-containing protein [Shewanella submarina]MCL1037384.1 DUF192 domain-containing protein [Shewanella submarina]